MQQYLPFTVLKLGAWAKAGAGQSVATVLTVYGIETTITIMDTYNFNTIVATVLTVYGIETSWENFPVPEIDTVATVLTVYGIETPNTT